MLAPVSKGLLVFVFFGFLANFAKLIYFLKFIPTAQDFSSADFSASGISEVSIPSSYFMLRSEN
jgi:hypothetical protein